jgi:hypothetical protein
LLGRPVLHANCGRAHGNASEPATPFAGVRAPPRAQSPLASPSRSRSDADSVLGGKRGRRPARTPAPRRPDGLAVRRVGAVGRGGTLSPRLLRASSPPADARSAGRVARRSARRRRLHLRRSFADSGGQLSRRDRPCCATRGLRALSRARAGSRHRTRVGAREGGTGRPNEYAFAPSSPAEFFVLGSRPDQAVRGGSRRAQKTRNAAISSLSLRANARRSARSPWRCRATARRCSTAMDAAAGGVFTTRRALAARSSL